MARWTANPPLGQVICGWIGAMIVLGIAGGWLFAPTEVTLHTVPMTPRTATSSETSAGTSDESPAGTSSRKPRPAKSRPAEARPAKPQPAKRGRERP